MLSSNEILGDRFFIFIAVRLKSRRLSKKALIDIEGTPLLNHLISRLLNVFSPDQVVVCTSTAAGDDALEKVADFMNVRCFRGSELDVMRRFIEAANFFGATTIARVTGDNPLTDAETLALMYHHHVLGSAEYTYTQDLPNGTRAEIIAVNALKRIHPQLKEPDASEYMTYMLQDESKVKQLQYDVKKSELVRPNLCFTVDTSTQLRGLIKMCKNFNGSFPSLDVIIDWAESQSEIDYTFKNPPPNQKLLERCGYLSR